MSEQAIAYTRIIGRSLDDISEIVCSALCRRQDTDERVEQVLA